VKKIDAFWDSSALVPLCVDQGASTLAKAALKHRSLAVWWGTPVEMMSAFARLLRSGDISQEDFEMALGRLAELRRRWIEVQPTEALRVVAEKLLQQHSLRAADALQLAAALVWAKQHPQKRAFVCFDGRLAEAAQKENLSVETL
jgi:predicted nucleic acid-binding protein